MNDDTATPYSRASAGAGARSGGKITKRRRVAAARTPYDRPPPPPPENSRTNWLTGHVLPSTSRIIAKGALKLLAFMTDTNSISDDDDSEDEDDVASCDDDDVSLEKDNTSTEMINREEPQISGKSPKWVIEKLLLQETFSKEESDKLIEIIKSRVVDCSTMEEGQGADIMETRSRRFDTPDRCSKAIMEAKYWLEEKKAGLSSKSDMDYGLSAFGSVPSMHLTKGDKGSPVDVAKSYMQARPPWASPLRHSGSKTPSPMAIDLFKDEKLSSVDGGSFPSAQKRGSLSAGSWTIQDEIRKVRSKATEDMLRSLPSKRIDLSSFTSEHKNIQSAVDASFVPDDGSDKMHVSKPLPETEPVDASVSLVAGSNTNNDSEGSALGMKQDHLQAEHLSINPDTSVSEPNQDLNVKEGTTTDSHKSISLEHLAKQHDANDTNPKVASSKYFLRNSGQPKVNGSASPKSSLSAGADVEQVPKQPDNNPTTSISAEEVCGFLSEASLEIPLNEINSTAVGSQDLQDSAHQVDVKNGMPVNEGLNEKQPERKSGKNQRRARGKGK